MAILIRNGRLVIKNGDKPAFPVDAPCAGTNCMGHTGTAGIAPSTLLTVFDADYVGGNITWAGETWTQAQVQAGESRCVCPLTYIYQRFLTNTPFTSAIHKWTNTNLFFERFYTNIGNTDRGVLKVGFPGTYGYSIVTGFGFSSAFFPGSPIINYGDPVSATSVTTKSMPDVYFFSFIDAGVQFTWEKGDNW